MGRISRSYPKGKLKLRAITFAKELIESRYNKGKIGVSIWKNGISYLNKFEEYLLLEHKGTHGEHNELIYVSEINEDLLIDFRKYRFLAKKKTTTVNKTLSPIYSKRVNMLVSWVMYLIT